MKKTIYIESSDKTIRLSADILDNPTSRKILEYLPITAQFRLWGEEIYFETGIEAPAENLTTDIEIGDFAYWPEGKGLCIFFGPTPNSKSDKPVPASAVALIGKINLNREGLRGVSSGTTIRIE